VQARRLSGAGEVAVAVDGGHGEWFVSTAPLVAVSLTPTDAAAIAIDSVAGARAADLVALRGFGCAIAAEADAREALDLAPEAMLAAATPLYGRAPDAKVAAA
jgi:tRNA threonylcarbamoyladenosine biosynthesis protein TsaB